MPEQEFDLLNYAKEHSLEDELEREVEVTPGFFVTVLYIGRSAWRKLFRAMNRTKGTSEKKERATEERTRAQLARAIKSWRGATPEVIADLIPVDPKGLPEELPCTDRNKKALLIHSAEFQNEVWEAVNNLAEFQEERRQELEKNSQTSPGGTSSPAGRSAPSA